MIKTLLPDNITSEIAYATTATPYIHEEEIHDIQNASKIRQHEFLNGRNCAHLALKKLGYKPFEAILRGQNREPIWPDSIVGSITHCDGYFAASVAYQKDTNGIGIDAELNTNLPRKMLLTTQTTKEITTNTVLNKSKSGVCINKLVFSAKESVFKFIYPFTKHYINFMDIEIILDFNLRIFSVTFITPDLISKFEGSNLIGKFNYNKKHIVTCVYQQAVICD